MLSEVRDSQSWLGGPQGCLVLRLLDIQALLEAIEGLGIEWWAGSSPGLRGKGKLWLIPWRGFWGVLGLTVAVGLSLAWLWLGAEKGLL